MSPSRTFISALACSAFLAAFLGSLGWFIWAGTQRTDGSCYDTSHYVPSATMMLVAVVLLTIARRRPRHRPSKPPLLGQAVATTAWTVLGLSLAVWLAAAISCSA